MLGKSLFAASALFGFTVLGAAPAFADATTWDIDSSHTDVGFTVSHVAISKVHGWFGKVSGKLVYDPKNPTAATVEVSIDPTSIDTHEAKRDGHLQSPDFFDVAKFPTITFKSTKVKAEGKGKLSVTGDLTLHGVTKPVVLEVTGPSDESKDPFGNVKLAASATGTIDRKDFGLVWNKPLEKAGSVLIGDQVTLQIEAELNKAK